MDAMISNCVNSIAQKERQLTKERKGKQAPIYNWETSGELTTCTYMCPHICQVTTIRYIIRLY